jgi:NAD-dependent dihydropyrimidine dehydrogenase PreA subunit
MKTNKLAAVIKIDEEKCVNCHACIATCPVKYCNNGAGEGR